MRVCRRLALRIVKRWGSKNGFAERRGGMCEIGQYVGTREHAYDRVVIARAKSWERALLSIGFKRVVRGVA
jgi:hypothetical protein